MTVTAHAKKEIGILKYPGNSGEMSFEEDGRSLAMARSHVATREPECGDMGEQRHQAGGRLPSANGAAIRAQECATADGCSQA